MTKELSLFHKLMDDAMASAFPVTSGSSYPPTDILRHGDNSFTITMAVSGFEKRELSVTREGDVLVISGERAPMDLPVIADKESVYIQRGIAQRKFRREFLLGDTLEISSAALIDGQLVVVLDVTIPDTDATVDIPIF